MPEWIDVVDASQVPEGDKLCTQAGDLPLVICHVNGAWYAVRNVCPHAGLPLGEGDLRGLVLTCPFHGYAYNVSNGRNVDWPHDELPATTYPVRVHEGTVQVELADD